jgi:hypothetical protein
LAENNIDPSTSVHPPTQPEELNRLKGVFKYLFSDSSGLRQRIKRRFPTIAILHVLTSVFLPGFSTPLQVMESGRSRSGSANFFGSFRQITNKQKFYLSSLHFSSLRSLSGAVVRPQRKRNSDIFAPD